MTFVEELGVSLSVREMQIYTGEAGLPEAKRLAYVELFKSKGQASKPFSAKEPAVLPEPDLPCIYRGDKTGSQVGCAKCHALPMMDVHSCSIHGQCVTQNRPKSKGIEWCKFCKDRVAAKPEPKMVMPGDVRPHVWKGGIIQIMVTRACDRACPNCTQGSNLKGPSTPMKVDQFRTACESLQDYFGVIGMFGGNPCIHPQFEELCEVMRGAIPWERRGLWSNAPWGNGRHAAITFNPAVSNLNVHQYQPAYDEFVRDWPECKPFLKGLDSDSRHSPTFVAMKDVIPDKSARDELILNCDINKNWSALIGTFRGELRAWFCEIAGAQAMLHQHEPDYPDTGVPVVPGWWKRDESAFKHQIDKHCHDCGIPLKGHGALANDSYGKSQYSDTHSNVYRTKIGYTEKVTELIQLGSPLKRVTDYIENGAIQ